MVLSTLGDLPKDLVEHKVQPPAVIVIGGKKAVLFHPSLLADLVILDPELTVALPPKLTAATGARATLTLYPWGVTTERP